MIVVVYCSADLSCVLRNCRHIDISKSQQVDGLLKELSIRRSHGPFNPILYSHLCGTGSRYHSDSRAVGEHEHRLGSEPRLTFRSQPYFETNSRSGSCKLAASELLGRMSPLVVESVERLTRNCNHARRMKRNHTLERPGRHAVGI